MSDFTITRGSGGVYDVLRKGEIIATVRFDPIDGEWFIAADRDVFETAADLPSRFRGRHTHSVRGFGNVYRFFDLPLPGASVLASAPEARAESTLIRAAHARGAALPVAAE